MKGSFTIKVSTKRIEYNLKINRNITVIKGDSATGKSTLISLIQRYYEQGNKSGVKLQCDRVCMTIGGRDWEKLLLGVHNTIVFIDEGNSFIKSHDFSRAIQSSDNYYVLITREDLKSLPYSINEIYGLRESKHKKDMKKTYNEMYYLYGTYKSQSIIKPSLIITEDSNAGYDFFEKVCNRYGIKCISGKGRDKLIEQIKDIDENNVLIIADGAAYGCAINITLEKLNKYKNYCIFLPESFEWLLLKSGIIKDNNLDDILENTSKYVESKDYFSWERFFTSLIEELTKSSNYIEQYNKNNKVPRTFLHEENIQKILSNLPPNIKISK